MWYNEDVLLSDVDIKRFIEQRQILLSPFDEAMIQPASVDVRLDRGFRVFNNYQYTHIDPKVEQPDLTREIIADDENGFVLHPGEFALATTFETVKLGNKVAARFEGKSSLGRLALATHITAGFIDPGFHGQVTLELSNLNTLPIKLYPGMKIGQLAFFEMSSPVEHTYGSGIYGSHYSGESAGVQRGPTPSRIHQNFHVTKLPNL